MINGKTRLLGLLGAPVDHSLSPAMQNAALQQMKLNWQYLALPCEKEHLSTILDALINVDCQGLNITIPHKNIIAGLCQELSPLAEQIGAVNTLIPCKNGGWYGTNTDVEGFVAPLKKLNQINNEKAIIIGCGGSARAVLVGLKILKFKEIKIISRKHDSLNKFINDIKIQDLLINSQSKIQGLLDSDLKIKEIIKDADLIINTTPVGMKSKEQNKMNIFPLSKDIWKGLNPKTTLYDLIYTPRPTDWLKLGREAGCVTIDGLEMLIQQGAASLRLWSGIEEIPISVMRKAAESQLII